MCLLKRTLGHPAVLALLVGYGCATPPQVVMEKKAPKRLYYTLRMDPKAAVAAPFPSETDVYVDWHYNDGTTVSGLGFRAWRVLSTNGFDMVEVLGTKGEVLSTLFDFKANGRFADELDESLVDENLDEHPEEMNGPSAP